MFIAGAEAGGQHNNYGQLGLIAPLPGSQLGNGFVWRAFIDGLTYRYDKNATDIEASSIGVDTSIGYSASNAQGWWGLSAGPAWRNTDLSPNDPANDANGSETSLRISAEAEHNFTETLRGNVITSYNAFSDNGFWNRARLLARVDGKIYAGPEVVWQGSDAYRAWQFGAAVTGIPVSDTTSIGLKAGFRKGEGLSATPYIGVEYGAVF